MHTNTMMKIGDEAARRLRSDWAPVNRGQTRFGEPTAEPRPWQSDAGRGGLDGKLVVMIEQPPEKRRSERRAGHHREQALGDRAPAAPRPSLPRPASVQQRVFAHLRARASLPKGANAASIRSNHVRTACRSNDNGFASSRSPSANALRSTISLTLPWSRCSSGIRTALAPFSTADRMAGCARTASN